MAAGFGREETLSGIQSNRWSEDGGSSSATMRTAAQQMENRIVAMLAAAAPANFNHRKTANNCGSKECSTYHNPIHYYN